MIVELEGYCDVDDQVRSIINRRGRVKDLAKLVILSYTLLG